MATARADNLQAFAGLLQPYRYKVYHGGRGSGKSWTFATILITRAAERSLRILCTRETMSSIRESVHQLLSDRIYALDLADQFVIEKASGSFRAILAMIRHPIRPTHCAMLRSLCRERDGRATSIHRSPSFTSRVGAPGTGRCGSDHTGREGKPPGECA